MIGSKFAASQGQLFREKNSKFEGELLQILAPVAEFEMEIIKERTLLGVRAANAKGKVVAVLCVCSDVIRSSSYANRAYRGAGSRRG